MDTSLLTAVLTGIISATATCLINRWQLKNEIKKLKLSWQHQNAASDQSAMTNALRFTALYLHDDPDMYYDQDLAMVSTAQPYFKGRLGDALDNLYHSLSRKDRKLVMEYYDTVISLYRKQIH